jgi:hypothetical protein
LTAKQVLLGDISRQEFAGKFPQSGLHIFNVKPLECQIAKITNMFLWLFLQDRRRKTLFSTACAPAAAQNPSGFAVFTFASKH